MRDWHAVAGVIVVALGLGGLAASLSVDLSPPGLDLIRPPKPAVVEQIKRVEKQRAVQAQASGCKHCSSVAELAQQFTRRAETARTHASALKAALPKISDETAMMASRLEELKTAEAQAVRAEEAASVLTGWASRCTSEEFCKAQPVRARSCAPAGDERTAATVLIAAAVREAASTCAAAACPSIDCQASGALRTDLGEIERTLDDAGGKLTAPADKTQAASLPVGASTFGAELKRINDESAYVTKMVPLLLDRSKAKGELTKLAPAMIDQRALSAAQLANVMLEAVAVSDAKAQDPRNEAAWRLKSLAANLAALGKDTQAGSVKWERASDSIGAAFMDLARLHALLDRVSNVGAGDESCDGSVASAAQQLRDARAMLDLCRMRSACIGRGGAGTSMKAGASSANVFERAQTAVQSLSVDELGADQALPVAESPTFAIDSLRSGGVCRRAGELREAKAAAPETAVAVAEAAVPPALSPATAGIMSPQDLISGAAETALNAPAASEAPTVATAAAVNEVQVEEVARFSASAPRYKPRRMLASDPDVVRVAAPPRVPTPDLAPAYQGVVLPEAGAPASHSFGDGAGGPTKAVPPVSSTPIQD